MEEWRLERMVRRWEMKNGDLGFAVSTGIWLREQWFVMRFSMRVFKWTSKFRIDAASTIAPVCVSFSLLRILFFKKESLFSIGKTLGQPLKMDAATAEFTRPSVARHRGMGFHVGDAVVREASCFGTAMDSYVVRWARIWVGKQVDLNPLLRSNGFLKSINVDSVQEVYDKSSKDCLSINSEEIDGKFDSKSVQLEDVKDYFQPKHNVPLTFDVSPRITAKW
ncbi:hypothetical protein LguiB_001526 [Lonicera macranthoides]